MCSLLRNHGSEVLVREPRLNRLYPVFSIVTNNNDLFNLGPVGQHLSVSDMSISKWETHGNALFELEQTCCVPLGTTIWNKVCVFVCICVECLSMHVCVCVCVCVRLHIGRGIGDDSNN